MGEMERVIWIIRKCGGSLVTADVHDRWEGGSHASFGLIDASETDTGEVYGGKTGAGLLIIKWRMLRLRPA